MYQFRALEGDYTGNYGLALAHPLYIGMGKAVFFFFKGATGIFLLNALSGVGASVTLANLTIANFLLVKKWWIALIVSLMLSTSHTFWWLCSIAEVYTWSVAGLTLELLIFILFLQTPHWQTFSILMLINGLGLTLHNFALLPLPVYVVAALIMVLEKRLTWWALCLGAFAYFLGSSIYIAMIIDYAIEERDLLAVAKSALYGRFEANALNVTSLNNNFAANFALTSLNFINLVIPLAMIGLIKARSYIGKKLANYLFIVLLIEFIFFSRYNTIDQFTFVLPTLIMIAVFASIGLGHVNQMGERWRTTIIAACIVSIFFSPIIYIVGPSFLETMNIDVRQRRALPYRDESRYWLLPWKYNEESAQKFARDALRGVDQDSVILADSTAAYPLLLTQRIERMRPDVLVLNKDDYPLVKEPDYLEFLDTVNNRSLYVVSPIKGYVPEKIIENATFIQEGILYRVIFDNQ